MATLIGLTGGIGSGKSTVAAILQKYGMTIVDADAISRSTTAIDGAAIPAIRSVFGADFLDATGALNRIKMRELVFSDHLAKTKLEAIIHPMIKLEMERQIQAAQSHLVALDLPLLAENTGFGGWRSRLNKVCVVDCLPQTQIDRVMARSGMKFEQVQAVMANQATRQARLAIADVVVCNENLSLAELELRVKTVIIGA